MQHCVNGDCLSQWKMPKFDPLWNRTFGAKAGSSLALFCIHHMNRVNSHKDSTINIVLVISISIIIIITYQLVY